MKEGIQRHPEKHKCFLMKEDRIIIIENNILEIVNDCIFANATCPTIIDFREGKSNKEKSKLDTRDCQCLCTQESSNTWEENFETWKIFLDTYQIPYLSFSMFLHYQTPRF